MKSIVDKPFRLLLSLLGLLGIEVFAIFAGASLHVLLAAYQWKLPRID